MVRYRSVSVFTSSMIKYCTRDAILGSAILMQNMHLEYCLALYYASAWQILSYEYAMRSTVVHRVQYRNNDAVKYVAVYWTQLNINTTSQRSTQHNTTRHSASRFWCFVPCRELLSRRKGRFFYRMVEGSTPQWILTHPLSNAPRTGDGLFPGEVIEVTQVSHYNCHYNCQ